MHVLDYLYRYQNIDFKEVPFNEVDALVLAMVSYFPFDELKNQKDIYSSDELLKRIAEYNPPRSVGERKLNYIELVKVVCRSIRFKHAKFAWFAKERDVVNSKQFQAITIILHDFAYVSFCGTDSTTLGWKEDFNMAYLDTVPSEIEAVRYLQDVSYNFVFKKMYVLTVISLTIKTSTTTALRLSTNGHSWSGRRSAPTSSSCSMACPWCSWS